MKNINEMTDRELLEELVKKERRNTYLEIGRWGLMIAFIVFIYAQVAPFIPRVKTVIDELETTAQSVNAVVGSIDMKTFEDLGNIVGSFDPKTLENLDKITSTLDPNTLEDLNKVVASLNDGKLEKLDQILSLFDVFLGR